MDFSLNEEQRAIEAAIGDICDKFDDNYWYIADKEKKFPYEFSDALVQSGWMGVTISEEYGGAGLGITEASIILKRIGCSCRRLVSAYQSVWPASGSGIWHAGIEGTHAVNGVEFPYKSGGGELGAQRSVSEFGF